MTRRDYEASPDSIIVRELRRTVVHTYLSLRRGWLYLVAVMHWFSRCALAWQTSVTLDASFYVVVLQQALTLGTPGIFNTD